MSNLPRVSGRECVKAFLKIGFEFKRQKGSHIILRRQFPFSQLVVPDHMELDRGTLRLLSVRPTLLLILLMNCFDGQ
jgi:predicted RNA binding protein YcfA (HicA-like mRNA interferase family)